MAAKVSSSTSCDKSAAIIRPSLLTTEEPCISPIFLNSLRIATSFSCLVSTIV